MLVEKERVLPARATAWSKAHPSVIAGTHMEQASSRPCKRQRPALLQALRPDHASHAVAYSRRLVRRDRLPVGRARVAPRDREMEAPSSSERVNGTLLRLRAP